MSETRLTQTKPFGFSFCTLCGKNLQSGDGLPEVNIITTGSLEVKKIGQVRFKQQIAPGSPYSVPDSVVIKAIQRGDTTMTQGTATVIYDVTKREIVVEDEPQRSFKDHKCQTRSKLAPEDLSDSDLSDSELSSDFSDSELPETSDTQSKIQRLQRNITKNIKKKARIEKERSELRKEIAKEQELQAKMKAALASKLKTKES